MFDKSLWPSNCLKTDFIDLPYLPDNTMFFIFAQQNLQANLAERNILPGGAGNLPPGVAPPPHDQLGEGWLFCAFLSV